MAHSDRGEGAPDRNSFSKCALTPKNPEFLLMKVCLSRSALVGVAVEACESKLCLTIISQSLIKLHFSYGGGGEIGRAHV